MGFIELLLLSIGLAMDAFAGGIILILILNLFFLKEYFTDIK